MSFAFITHLTAPYVCLLKTMISEEVGHLGIAKLYISVTKYQLLYITAGECLPGGEQFFRVQTSKDTAQVPVIPCN